ncbi:MAG: hypothetical protein DRO09_00055 [Thermoprotei archaeon]|nr:MAG: hypothetical protein DRO09_00055 [Thermoprotei archaeon]
MTIVYDPSRRESVLAAKTQIRYEYSLLLRASLLCNQLEAVLRELGIPTHPLNDIRKQLSNTKEFLRSMEEDLNKLLRPRRLTKSEVCR